jgi:hypothetical protein
MRTIIPFFFVAGIAFGQLPPASGDDFTIAVYNDIHTDNNPAAWTNAVDWLVGANGRGPGGMAAVAYWNIKAIAGVGDYVTSCNDTNWNAFLAGWYRINALGLPGIWPQGNHDLCGQYTASFGSSLQSTTVDVSTTLGVVRLGLLGVGVADDMSEGHPSRMWADRVLEAAQPDRQWIFLRHVGTYAPYASPGPYGYPADGDSGWCKTNAECAGYGNAGVALRDSFYAQEQGVYWGVHGHNGYVAVNSMTADDGHPVQVTGNLGASGGTPGWITLLKFRPSQHDVQVAVYLSQNGAAGSIYAGPYTWPWSPRRANGRRVEPRKPGRGRGEVLENERVPPKNAP